MSPLLRPDQQVDDPQRLAAVARSILSCPAEVDLLVDGVATALEGGAAPELHDTDGSPTFTCPVGSDLAEAGQLGRSALLTIASGLGPEGSSERADSLVLTGRLELLGTQHCDCCAETRQVIGLRLNVVLLTRAGASPQEQLQLRVPVEHFSSPAHHLNRGVLQRSAEHANDHHQDELRRAVSLTSRTRMTDVVGVRLSALSARGVEVSWVDVEGAHRTLVHFPRPARTLAELGDLLRRELHAGLC